MKSEIEIFFFKFVFLFNNIFIHAMLIPDTMNDFYNALQDLTLTLYWVNCYLIFIHITVVGKNTRLGFSVPLRINLT